MEKKVRRKKILLAVDLQEDFAEEPGYSRCMDYIKSHRRDYVRVISVYFANPMRYYGNGKEAGRSNPDYLRYLGFSNDGISRDEIRHFTMVPDSRDENIVRDGYLIPGNMSAINSSGYLPVKCAYDIMGANIESSIMAIAFQLFSRGYEFNILTDYCYTLGNREIYECAAKLMERNFGKAVVRGQ